ncbi:MAG TPA: response regulator, partial [Bryobacteraceae bacterium]|nr:response regulator [Bryobacteraceae bacterium]
RASDVPLRDGPILVAEDDEAVRKLVSSVLRANNYVVLEAKDGAEALQIASRNVNSIALVIAVPALPLLSGSRLVERLWILRPDIGVLYISADGDSTGLGAGGAGVKFLQKPFSVTALLFTVDAMLGRRPQRA